VATFSSTPHSAGISAAEKKIRLLASMDLRRTNAVFVNL